MRNVAIGTLGLLVALTSTSAPHGAHAAPDDCAAVSQWIDYFYTVRDRQDALGQREADLSRDASISTDELAAGLAAIGAERADLNAEFQEHPAPSSARPAQTAYSLAWELDALISNAYLRAIRTGDERQRGIADGYTESSGTIEARAGQLLDALLATCNQ